MTRKKTERFTSKASYVYRMYNVLLAHVSHLIPFYSVEIHKHHMKYVNRNSINFECTQMYDFHCILSIELEINLQKTENLCCIYWLL